jgi:hypothetical protein
MSSDTKITSNDYKIGLNAPTIDKVPRGTTVKEFNSKITLPQGATSKVLELDHSTVFPEGKLKGVMFLEVTAEDGTVVYYWANVDRNNEAYLKPGNYVINEKDKILSGVIQNINYKDFLDSLVLPEGAVAKIYSFDHKNIITSGFVNNTMILRISAENIYTYREYKIRTEPIKIKLGSKFLSTSIIPAVMNKTVYMPAEAFVKSLGAKYTYDKVKSAISINKTNISIIMNISSTATIVNKNTFSIEAPPILINGIPYVSTKFVAEMLNYSYKFDEKTKIVEIK